MRVIADALNEEMYMASMAEFNIQVSRTLTGRINLKIAGFNEKLLKVFENIGDELFTPFEVNEKIPQHTGK